MEKYNLPDAWMKYAKKHSIFIIIPKDTLIYRGTSVYDKSINLNYKFFSDFNTACWYAFSSDFQKGEMGKVICMRLKENLILFDIDNVYTFKFFYKYFRNIPKYDDDTDVIKYAFGYDNNKPITEQVLKRTSNLQIDIMFCNWLINSTKKINIDGYGFMGTNNFHNEVMIYEKNLNKLKIIPIEYRFVIDYKENKLSNNFILEIKNGMLIRSIPNKSIVLYNGTTLSICWNRHNMYKPNIKNKMDSFYFDDIYKSSKDYEEEMPLIIYKKYKDF
ncbi:hypothetical protein QJ854_gp117 [Moumouvirus goulette]|uniref:Uncharacterized protein n=1 Tax=Moumouvirus goulette TaxID=1247379 RepID=M1NNM5_9VIRU|nr:hypothetical protein QJ854_gp117 [Moumouvirus goulette]AGF85665.1 hypothetical protein glt_00862 [Moumouvirus goulette]